MFTVEIKKCTKCGEVKLAKFFYKNKKSKYGLTSQCKNCINTYVSSYKDKNKDRLSAERKAKYIPKREKYRFAMVDYTKERATKEARVYINRSELMRDNYTLYKYLKKENLLNDLLPSQQGKHNKYLKKQQSEI